MGRTGPPKGTPPTEEQAKWLFQKGQSGNPRGPTSEQMKRALENARKATEIRAKFLDTMQSRIRTIEIQEQDEPEQAEIRILTLLNSDVNRLLTDSEDRGYGKATQMKKVDATVRATARTITTEMSQQEAAEAYKDLLDADDDEEDEDED